MHGPLVSLWIALVLSACAPDLTTNVPAQYGPVQSGVDQFWTKVELDHVAGIGCCGGNGRGLEGLLAVTDHGVVHVIRGSEPRPLITKGSSPAGLNITSFAVDDAVENARFATSGADGAVLWESFDWGWSDPRTERLPTPATSAGARVDVALPLFDNEGGAKAVTTETGRVLAWSDEGSGAWARSDSGAPLTLVDGRLLASSEEVMTVVGGHLRDVSGEAVGLWWTAGDHVDGPTPWERVDLPGGPEEVTDLMSWEIGTWVVGRRKTTPLMWNADFNGLRAIPMPRTELDPADPRVIVGDNFQGRLIATQSIDGPMIWTRAEKAKVWKRYRAPRGRIVEVSQVDNELFALIDDTVWTLTAPALE